MKQQAIRQTAKQYGFDLCFFARPEITNQHVHGYQRWVREGMQGEMAWMVEESRSERRVNPSLMLAEVRTVITVGMRMTPPPYTLEDTSQMPDSGVIAAYAQGHDYHKIMKKRLKQLAHELDDGEHDQRVYVDTAPILEHALAEQSGLGWQGKHSLTIDRDTGSWMMLGEIFTTAMIQPDRPAKHHCGTCIACMDVCTTHAIVAPYVVDARLCISYLTIEYKGMIPRHLRPLMGNHIFGCDDCQMVCPWNRHAVAPDPDLLMPQKENILPELISFIRLDDAGFRDRFRTSPVRRLGRADFLRNVIIAMGNSGNARYIADLLLSLHDQEAIIRGHAAWALASLVPRIKDAAERQKTRATIKAAYRQEKDMQIQSEMAWVNE